MSVLIGRLALYLCLFSAIGGAATQLRSLKKETAPATWPWGVAALVGIVLAMATMMVAFVTHNFSLAYVAENNATFTPLLYSITGVWSALEGSLLLWVLLQSLVVIGVLGYYRKKKNEQVVRVASVVLFCVQAFFTFLLVGPADPFIKNSAHVLQGAGPNALLQDNPLVAIHPPLLYLGFVGFSVPFAFAIAVLVSGRVSERWALEQRRWTVLAWGALSVGVVLGSWWSYQVLGWGGFWGWDPVENAALLPWLTATAYIHSVIVQDRRGLFRVWNLALAVATFALTVLGTFFTRSGVLQSVHAFSSSTLGPILMGMFIVVVAIGAGLIIWRGDRLRSSVGVEQPFSREGLFVANNILFVGFAIVVLVGTVFPLLYEAVNGQQVTVGTPYFANVAAPAGVFILALMGVAPIASWRSVDPGVLWNRIRPIAWAAWTAGATAILFGVRKSVVLASLMLGVFAAGAAIRTLYGLWKSASEKGERKHLWRSPSVGGMVVHLGVVILALGIVASTSYAFRSEVVLAKGESTIVNGHRIGFGGFRTIDNALERSTQLKVTVDGAHLWPAITTFKGRSSQSVGTPAIDSNLLRDVYITFDAIGGNGAASGAQVQANLPAGSVVLGVTAEPLLAWLWIGGLIIGLGSALSFVRRPHRSEERA